MSHHSDPKRGPSVDNGSRINPSSKPPFTYRYRHVLLVLFACLFGAAVLYGRSTAGELVAGGFDDPKSESSRAEALLDAEFGLGTPDVVVAYRHPRWTVYEGEFRALLGPAIGRMRLVPGVEAVGSPYDPTPSALISKDGHTTVVTVRLSGSGRALQTGFDALSKQLHVAGLSTLVGGAVPGSRQAEQAAEDDLVRAELITLPLLAVLLVIFFRGVVAASIPLLVGGFSVASALAGVRLLTHVTDVSVFAMNIVTFVGLGVAVDYSLFMTSRFRDELSTGQGVESAIRKTLKTAGRTVAYSGLAVAVSLLSLMVFPVMLLRSVAVAGSLVVLMTLLGALVFLPAMLSILGHRIHWLSLPSKHVQRTPRLWKAVAAGVMRAPVLVTSVVSVILIVLGLPFLRMDAAISGAAVLPEAAEARRVAELVESDQFSHQTSAPVQIVAMTSDEVLSDSGLSAVERYAKRIGEISHVSGVAAVVGGTGSASSKQVGEQLRSPLAPAIRARLSRWAHGHTTAMSISMDVPPTSAEALATLKAIRAVREPRVHALVTGPAARLLDLKSALADNAPWALVIICLATFVVLFMAFGSVIMPLSAILMNLLSLTASFGALVWIFQDGRFEGLLNYRSPGSIELTIPVIMFAVMFGLAMDYELFLLSRIREAYDDTGDTHGSVTKGLEQTGRIITRAAMLLVAVMVGFMTADMLIVKEIGVGMAVAIIVDATIVRALLVPATMQLLGDYSWWSPPPLARLWERMSLGVDERSEPKIVVHTP